jgi:hypothetical protein
MGGLGAIFGRGAGKALGSGLGKLIGGKAGKKLGGALGAEAGTLAGATLTPYKKGGRVPKTGPALLHKNEFVLPANVKPTKAQKAAVAKGKRGGKKSIDTMFV